MTEAQLGVLGSDLLKYINEISKHRYTISVQSICKSINTSNGHVKHFEEYILIRILHIIKEIPEEEYLTFDIEEYVNCINTDTTKFSDLEDELKKLIKKKIFEIEFSLQK